eukprot:5669962-Prymnesium_polylepis.1
MLGQPRGHRPRKGVHEQGVEGVPRLPQPARSDGQLRVQRHSADEEPEHVRRHAAADALLGGGVGVPEAVRLH